MKVFLSELAESKLLKLSEYLLENWNLKTTNHTRTRCEQFKPTLPILTENRMLKNVELNSKRLKTRNLNEGDIEKLFKIYSDKESMKFRGSKPMNKIADASKMIFDQTIEKNNIIKIRKAIIKKENKELIGTLLLECDKSFPNRCEIGFSFEKSEWNNGYGKETLDMVLEKLKTINSIKEVKAWCIKKNIASVKILEKKGFTRINQNEFPESYLFIKELKKTAHNN